MATIITRVTSGAGATTNKGSTLTSTEIDYNFMNLNVELGTKVSAANLKTVNSQSLVGTGNIVLPDPIVMAIIFGG